jgi:hypothetical protein
MICGKVRGKGDNVLMLMISWILIQTVAPKLSLHRLYCDLDWKCDKKNL